MRAYVSDSRNSSPGWYSDGSRRFMTEKESSSQSAKSRLFYEDAGNHRRHWSRSHNRLLQVAYHHASRTEPRRGRAVDHYQQHQHEESGGSGYGKPPDRAHKLFRRRDSHIGESWSRLWTACGQHSSHCLRRDRRAIAAAADQHRRSYTRGGAPAGILAGGAHRYALYDEGPLLSRSFFQREYSDCGAERSGSRLRAREILPRVGKRDLSR